VGEKTSKKAKLCFMQHLKVTFNRIKADIFNRFTIFVLLFGLRLMQQPDSLSKNIFDKLSDC